MPDNATQSAGRAVVVPIAYRLSMEDQARLTEHLLAQVRTAQTSGECVIADLTDWLYTDTGLSRTILRPFKEAKAAGVTFAVVKPGPPGPKERFESLMLHKLLTCYETLEDAVAALGIQEIRAAPVDRPTGPSVVDQVFANVKAQNALALVEARRAAHASGKEPFVLARLEQLLQDGSLAERAASLEMSYYVGHPEIRTLAAFVTLLRELEIWK